MVIPNGLSSLSAAIVFSIIFGSMILYLLAMIASSANEAKKIKKATSLIEEGHRRAVNGKRNDGIYREDKHRKQVEEIEECKQAARDLAKQDMSLLS